MNNTIERENNLFKKVASMTWVLHKYHQKNHHNSQNTKKHYEKYTENRILALLKLQEEISSKELMFILGIPKHYYKEAVEKMEKEEFILLTDSDNDTILKLTEKGRSAEIKNKKSEFDSIFDCLSEEEKENFGHYIDTIVSSVKSKFEDNSDNDTEFFDNFHIERDEFCRRDFAHPGIDGKEFYRSFLLNHGMDSNFNRCGEKHSPHRHPDFHGRHGMERRGHGRHDSHRDFMFERDPRFDRSDKRFDTRNERCGHTHGHNFHRDFDRNRDFDKGYDMESEKCRPGHDIPEDFEIFYHKRKI